MKAPPRRLMNDRISQLPQPILHNILRYLPQQEAVRTCTLSKSWRYLGSTRPNLDMREIEFKGSKRKFINVLERCLQLYLDHKICPEEFEVSMTSHAESFFNRHEENARFDPPSMIFEFKSLQRLTLRYCNLSRDDIRHSDMSSLTHLKKLRLTDVRITDEVLEKIIFSCPLIKLELSGCVGLRAIRIDKRARYLKQFEWSSSYDVNEWPSLELDVPSLEKIKINDCPNWYHNNKIYFPHLKSLSLYCVRLSTESFGFFSRNIPCLESLSLKYCFGCKEFELSSCSIKKFELSSRCGLFNRVAMDVPSVVMFKFEGHVPKSFSFTTTSEKWKSDITLRTNYLFEETSRGLGKLGQLLRAVSGSEMSLHINRITLSSHTMSSFMNNLFGICRPRIIQRSLVVGPESKCEFHKRRNKTTKLMCKILGMEKGRLQRGRITKGHEWRQDLEKVVFEIFDKKEGKWHPIVERSWSKFWKVLLPKDSTTVEHCMRFRLTWRE